MSLDQFYTRPEIALKCYKIVDSHIDMSKYDILLEPSAGTGSFFHLLDERRIGIDLEPKCAGVMEGDFLDYNAEPGQSYLVIGNPPFGRVSSLAVRFFNHAATFADVIAFIVPRTFKRVSIQNKLDLQFHLVYSEDIPLKPCAFTPSMSAKCCFQIWVRGETRAIIELPTTHPDWDFLKMGPLDERKQPTPPSNADFAMKAYGANCGEVVRSNLHMLRPKSWHWIKSNIPVERLIERFGMLDYSISKDTARQDSIGRGEVVKLYSEAFS